MLRVLKRIALLLFVFVAVAAAALYLLYFRRTPLPAAAPHARVVPVISTIPGITACWVETAKTFSNFSFGSTAGSVLVKHPAGDLLIDTGSSSQYDREISGYPFATWLKLKALAGQLKPKVPLPDLLRSIGRSRQTALGDPVACAPGSRRRLDGPAASAGAAHAGRAAICIRSERSGQGLRDCSAHRKVSACCRAHFAIRTGAVRNF